MRLKRFLTWIVTIMMLLTSLVLPVPTGIVREAAALNCTYNPNLAISKAPALLSQAAEQGWSGAAYVSAVLRAAGLADVNRSGAGDLLEYLNTPSHFGGSIGRIVIDPTGNQLKKGDILPVVCHKDGDPSTCTNGHGKGAGQYYGLQS